MLAGGVACPLALRPQHCTPMRPVTQLWSPPTASDATERRGPRARETESDCDDASSDPGSEQAKAKLAAMIAAKMGVLIGSPPLGVDPVRPVGQDVVRTDQH